jgi:nicotinate phosphoribosyltransferase
MFVPESILDTDQYKFSQQQAILELYPDAIAEYEFINRRPSDTFTARFLNELKTRLHGYGCGLVDLALSDDEYQWLKSHIPYFKPWYLEYLKNYRFNPDEVSIKLVDDQLKIKIVGPWRNTVLWEVPLMAMISETYFSDIGKINYDGQKEKAIYKAGRLRDHGCKFADFGTRRRRSYIAQDIVVQDMMKEAGSFFVGTSNVHFAKERGCKALGTVAHEWFQAHSVLGSLLHANRAALEAWVKVYHSDLGIALTDTYGTDAFFKDFDPYFARLFDGCRQDSGNTFTFVDKIVAHYQKIGIDPLTKTAIFSDNLNVDKAIEINEYCKGKIKCSFGIGTFFSNDFDGPKPLNMVIKLVKLNGIPVVKLSDDPSKAVGDRDAIRVARWTHFGTPLD